MLKTVTICLVVPAEIFRWHNHFHQHGWQDKSLQSDPEQPRALRLENFAKRQWDPGCVYLWINVPCIRVPLNLRAIFMYITRMCVYEREGEGGTRENDNVKKVRATEAGDPDERERTRLWLCVQPQLITLCVCTFVRVYVCSYVFVYLRTYVCGRIQGPRHTNANARARSQSQSIVSTPAPPPSPVSALLVPNLLPRLMLIRCKGTDIR